MKLLSISLFIALLTITLWSCRDEEKIYGTVNFSVKNSSGQPLNSIKIYSEELGKADDSTTTNMVPDKDSVQLSIGIKYRREGNFRIKVKTSEKELQTLFGGYSSSSELISPYKLTVFKDTIIVDQYFPQ